MKKYILKETGEEIEFGDTISLELEKTMGSMTETIETTCHFIPELVELFLENNIIEEYDDESIEARVTSLEGTVADLLDVVNQIRANNVKG